MFIHGPGSYSATGNDIPLALSEDFHTIAVDFVGFGISDKPKQIYAIHYFSQFIKNFLWQIEVKDQDKIIIIDHSSGGYIEENMQ